MSPVALPLVASLILAFAGDVRKVPSIGKIEIVAAEIFQDAVDESGFWGFRVADKLHIRTREEIIRQELLFAPGDPLDTEAIAQTERNLRALVFLRDARIETQTVNEDTVDIQVLTFDCWTTVPEIRFGKIGNRWVWTLGASERNLLGRGKWAEVSRRSDLDRDDTFFFYREPRLAGSRFAATASYSDQSDGSRAEFGLLRPFFALSTKWAFGLRLEGLDQLDPLYAHGERIADLRHVRRRAEVEMARAVVRSPSSAARLHLAYRRLDDEVEGDLRRFGILQIGISSVRHRFVKLTHVNRFEVAEDFNLGNEASAFFGISSGALGGEDGRAYFFLLREKRGIPLGREHFLTSEVSWSARHRRRQLENSLVFARLDYINKLSPRWLLAGTARFHYGTRLDPEVQMRLGAESGLRGYPVHQFVGNRSLIFNIEERFFIADEVARLVSFATAVFFDTGFAWAEGHSIDLGDLKSDVGVSLLLGRNRLAATHPGVRLDLAYALHPIEGRSRWLFSASSQVGF